MDTIHHFLTDVKTEAVKLQLQLSVPSNQEKQRNTILKNFFVEDFNSKATMDLIKDQIEVAEQCNSVECLKKLYDTWNRNRLIIQEEGYGVSPAGQERAGQAYGYVFLIRVLRQYIKR